MLVGSLLCAPMAVQAQSPITIKVTEIGDSTKFTITWKAVTNNLYYEFGSFSNPRVFDLEMIRTITGTPTWTITALRANLKDSLPFYVTIKTAVTLQGNIAGFLPAARASITYRLPPPPAVPAPPPPFEVMLSVLSGQ